MYIVSLRKTWSRVATNNTKTTNNCNTATVTAAIYSYYVFIAFYL